MRIAFAILRLVPAGGLEQHALRLAAILAARGHGVTFLTTQAPAEPMPAGVGFDILSSSGRTNHGRLLAFAADAARAARAFDRTVAFHIIPGFDVVFCAEPSRSRPTAAKALLPRYRTYAELERRSFGPAARSLACCAFPASSATPSSATTARRRNASSCCPQPSTGWTPTPGLRHRRPAPRLGRGSGLARRLRCGSGWACRRRPRGSTARLRPSPESRRRGCW